MEFKHFLGLSIQQTLAIKIISKKKAAWAMCKKYPFCIIWSCKLSYFLHKTDTFDLFPQKWKKRKRIPPSSVLMIRSSKPFLTIQWFSHWGLYLKMRSRPDLSKTGRPDSRI